MCQPDEVDVLIVGCGPVGATLANMLGSTGVRTLIIDKATEIFSAPRAIALDNDALRILQSIGIGEPQFTYVRIPYVRMISPIFGEFVRVNTAREIDTHPVQVTFHQPQLEEELRARLARQESVTVKLGAELVDFNDDGGSVTANLKSADGSSSRIRARYLVGADGASSCVRQLIGQNFHGRSFVEDWLIVDAVEARDPIDHIEFLCDPARPTPHMAAPGGRQRWEFMLARGETREQMETDEEIEQLLKPWGGLSAMTVERRAVYRFHARCADAFQKGRVFLAGDAAHITPPFVGQGLVSGLRDAANLSWKLDMAVRRAGNAGVLTSYDTERRPHAKSMIQLARFMGKAVMPRNRVAAFITHGVMRTARAVPGLRPLLEELGIKPKSRFRRGLFVRGVRRGTIRPGDIFPQTWVVGHGAAAIRSDELLGAGFVLVGFGVDPACGLGAASREALGALGILPVHLKNTDSPSLMAAAPHGTIALVRPDKVVLGLSTERNADRMLDAALRLLGAAA